MPGSETRHEARDRARQHDADHQPAHHIADHLAARVIRGKPRGEGHDHLDGDGPKPDREGRREEGKRCRGKPGGNKGCCDHTHHDQDQLAVLDEIAERHEEEQPQSVTDLGQRDDQTAGMQRQPDGFRDRAGERLGIIEIGGDQATGGGHDEGEAGGQAGRAGGFAGAWNGIGSGGCGGHDMVSGGGGGGSREVERSVEQGQERIGRRARAAGVLARFSGNADALKEGKDGKRRAVRVNRAGDGTVFLAVHEKAFDLGKGHGMRTRDPFGDVGVKEREFDRRPDGKAAPPPGLAAGGLGIEMEDRLDLLAAGRSAFKLFCKERCPHLLVAVEGGEEDRLLVLERLVDAAGRQAHGRLEIGDGCAVIAALGEDGDRRIEGGVDLEFAGPAGAATGNGGIGHHGFTQLGNDRFQIGALMQVVKRLCCPIRFWSNDQEN